MKEQTHSGRLFFLVIALILVSFLPLVLVISQQQQTYRSKAAEISPPPQPVVNTATTTTTTTAVNLPQEDWQGVSNTLGWHAYTETIKSDQEDYYDYGLTIYRVSTLETYQITWDNKGEVRLIGSYNGQEYKYAREPALQEQIAKKLKGALSSIFKATDFSGHIKIHQNQVTSFIRMTPQQKEIILDQTTRTLDDYINKLFARQYSDAQKANPPSLNSIVFPSDSFLLSSENAAVELDYVPFGNIRGAYMTIIIPPFSSYLDRREKYQIYWTTTSPTNKVEVIAYINDKYAENPMAQRQVVEKSIDYLNKLFVAKDFLGYGATTSRDGSQKTTYRLDENKKIEMFTQLIKLLEITKSSL